LGAIGTKRIKFGSVVLFGVLHEIQRTDLPEPHHSAARKNQRQQFVSALEELVEKYAIGIIGEEIGNHTSCVAEVARDGRKYLDVEMPRNDREARGCNPLYAERKLWEQGYSQRKDWRANVQNCHKIREDHMYRECIGATREGENLLLVCGIEHTLGMWGRFQGTANQLITESVFEYPWFDKNLWNASDAIIRLSRCQKKFMTMKRDQLNSKVT
jgi:hypothetical protein